VVIKTDWKDQRDDEQHHQYILVFSAYNQQTEEAKDEDYQFGYDNIREDRANEKAVFAFEERQANGAVMPDVKRAFYD
jgi:hypothetical protein